tara:strand:+ start:4226 stop:4918 length:693 start_codon:yes stop_codon:yes gene_type:complete
MSLNDESVGIERGRQFRFAIEGVNYLTTDPIQRAREILQTAGFEPASDHVLIQLMSPGSKSIGLDEAIDLREPKREEFRAFKTDRVFIFTIDEIGYEWGRSEISEDDLRGISGAAEDEILFLERSESADVELEPGMRIDLSERGTERIRTRKRTYRIWVNGREHELAESQASYEQVVILAFGSIPNDPKISFTVAYLKGPRENRKGTLAKGETVKIKNGMTFNVNKTNRS